MLVKRDWTITFAAVLAIVIMVLAMAFGSGSVRATIAPPMLEGATMAPNALVSVDTHTLQWTSGQAYPTINGKAVPPPDSPPSDVNASVPAAYGGHWYAGSVFKGTKNLTSWVLSEISVPSAGAPDSSEFYYVLLSIWDKMGSYDQIGFSDTYGVWGLTYSYTTGPCTSATYHYNPDYLSLTPGQEYLLAITTQPGTAGPGTWEEEYTVSAAGGAAGISLIFALHAPTGASNPGLEREAFYCGYYDYTDYEEVYGTTTYTQPDPYGAPGGFTWYFHENCYGSTGCNVFTPWKAWKSSNAPPGTSAKITSYKTIPEIVTISNFETLNGFVTG